MGVERISQQLQQTKTNSKLIINSNNSLLGLLRPNNEAQGDIESSLSKMRFGVFRFFIISDGRTSRYQFQFQLGKWTQGESNGK